MLQTGFACLCPGRWRWRDISGAIDDMVAGTYQPGYTPGRLPCRTAQNVLASSCSSSADNPTPAPTAACSLLGVLKLHSMNLMNCILAGMESDKVMEALFISSPQCCMCSLGAGPCTCGGIIASLKMGICLKGDVLALVGDAVVAAR